MNRSLVLAVILYAAMTPSLSLGGVPDETAGGSAPAYAAGEWKDEFEDICSRTQDAMVFSTEELKSLISRCDALKRQVEKLEQPHRKIMLKRLQMCRDMYSYVLRSKESN